MFDSIVRDVNKKYDLGDKADTLISALLSLMTDSANGGFAGFIERFRTAGLGGLADSWISSDANTSVSNEQLESALGEDTLREISEKIGADYKTTVGASGYVIPHLVDDLTPNGEIPNENDLLSNIGGYSTGVGTSSGDNGTSADDGVGHHLAESARRPAVLEHLLVVSAHLRELPEKILTALIRPELTDKTEVAGVPGIFVADADDEENPLLAWLLPLIILVLLIIVGYSFCGGKSEPVAVPEANTNTNKANVNAAK